MPFDPVAFCAAARAAVLRVKRAQVQRRPEVARAVMTEAAWAGLRAQVESLRAQDAWQHLDDLLIGDVTLVGSRADAPGETSVARVWVSARSFIVDRAGNALAGTREPEQWIEDWTFRRAIDPASLPPQAIVCPLCGAPLELDEDGLCTFCHDPAPGQPTDWLVVSTARVLEENATADLRGPSTPRQSRTVLDAAAAGVRAIATHDPQFTAGDVVIEAREGFLAIERAQVDLDATGIRAVVTDAFFHDQVARIAEAQASGRKSVRAYLELTGAVLSQATHDGSWDSVTVTVTGRSADHVLDIHTGRLLEGTEQLVTWSEDVFMIRSANAVTNPLTTPDAGICPACFGVYDVDDGGCCRSCGRHVTGGEFGWAVAHIEPLGRA